MQIKKDEYREEQVRTMLFHETNDKAAYGGNLSYSTKDCKPIFIEADVLHLLAEAYAGSYIEVNGPDQESSGEKYLFWCHYEYAELQHALLFVRLSGLNNRDIVNLLTKFDLLYADTNQDTKDWALEYQLLTRMLIHEKCLLVNPLYLDISEEEILQDLTDGMSDEDRDAYIEARALTRCEIWQMYSDDILRDMPDVTE